jgi:GntR family transcriptional repressor for pyruvate dehydrogenase complex
MEPLRKVRLSEQIVEVLKQKITEDGFSPGDKFYSENELTKKLQVSRSSVRDAVRILEVTGFVNVKQGKGIYISDAIEKGYGAFTNWMKNHEASIIEHFEVRLIIDPKAAAYAARNAEEDDIRKMEDACKDFIRYNKDKNTEGMIKSDELFHKILAKSTKNRTLYLLMKTMTESLSEGWITSLHIPGRINKTIVEHRSVIQAIKKGDSEAAEKAMSRHIQNALNDIRASIENQLEK